MNNLIIFFILLIIIILLNYNNNIEKFRCRDSPTYDCSNYVDYHLGGGYRGRAANQCLWKNRSLSGRRPCLECPQSCGEADTQAWCDRASWCTSASECLETPLCCPCTDNQVISEGKCTNLLCNQGQKLVRAISSNGEGEGPYCTPCPVNTYQSNNNHNYKRCEFCPKNTYTTGTGSTSISSCLPKTCDEGKKLIPRVTNSLYPASCSPCPINTYQSNNNHQITKCNVCNTVDCSATNIKSDCTSTKDKECYAADEYESFELPHPANWTEVSPGKWMMIPDDNKYGNGGVIDEEINPDAVKYKEFKEWLNTNMKWNFVTNCDYFNYGLDPENAEQQWNSGNENRGNYNMMRRSSTYNGKDFVVDPKGEWYMQRQNFMHGNPYVQVTLPEGYDKVKISYRQPKGLGNATWYGIDDGKDLKDDPVKRGMLKVTLNNIEISKKEGPSFTETLEWGSMKGAGDEEGFHPKPMNESVHTYAHTMFAIARPENAHSATETGWIDYTAGEILKIEGINPKDIPQNDYYYSPYWWECENEYGYYSLCGRDDWFYVDPVGPLGGVGVRGWKYGHDSPYLDYCESGWESTVENALCTRYSNPDRDASVYDDDKYYRYNCGRGCFVANSAEDSSAPITNTKDNEYGGTGSTANRNMFKHTTAIGGKFKIEVIKTI